MPRTADEVTRAVLHDATDVLEQCLTKIRHCVGQLSDEQVWWRPHRSMNSIGNLILHLTGNVRQWMLSGIGGSPDVRDRPAEFAETGPVPKAALLAGLEEVVSATREIFQKMTADEMLRTRRIQGFEVTGWKAVFDCVPHFKGHTQEIICLTRMQLQDGYQYHWQPQSAEQGAPAGKK